MLTQIQIEQFQRDGCLLIPGVLSKDHVRTLRAFFLPRLECVKHSTRLPGDSDGIMVDIFNRNPEISWLLFHQPTINILRSLLGPDFGVLRECCAHFNKFGRTWHKDTTGLERAGQKFQWDHDFMMVQVAYYLQDNSFEHGGGLDVVPGTHRKPDEFAATYGSPPTVWARLRRRLLGDRSPGGAMSVPSRAGDAVIFDLRINHRATQRRKEPDSEDNKKIAVFIECSSNTRHVQGFHRFNQNQPNYPHLSGYEYSPELLSQARQAGISLF